MLTAARIQYDGVFDFTMLERYKKIGIDIKHMDALYPTVVMHRNIVEYVSCVNPIVSNSRKEIQKAMSRWKQMLEILAINASFDNLPSKKKYVIGYYYPDTYIISEIKPQLPLVPRWLGYISGDEVVIVRTSNMRRLYINILRLLSKAVIVKPLFH